MQTLMPYAEKVAALLKSRNETIAVAESSSGGLIAAALLAVPGASAYFAGGAVLYTRNALVKFMNATEERLRGQQPGSEAYALLKAQLVRAHLSATWGLSENGVAGPTPNRYGQPPGHSCIALSGPIEQTKTIETRSTDRMANMIAFSQAALELLAANLSKGR
ncbi:MAG: CinA family protein [Burkholderiales bacterium]